MRFQVDSRYCWIQATSSFLFHAVFFGVSFSFGIFYVELLDEFPGKESELAWVSSINFAFLMLVSPLSVRAFDYVGARVVCGVGSVLGACGLYFASKASSFWMLYPTFGVMHGIGTNLCYMSAIWIVRQNFDKKKDAAFGFASSGGGAGGVIFGVLLPGMVRSHGWRGSLEILSYITLSFLSIAFTMIPVKQETREIEQRALRKFSLLRRSKRTQVTNFPSPWRNRAFVVLSLTIIMCAFVSLIPYCHIVNFAIQQGVKRDRGDLLPLFISAGSFLGRLVTGRMVGFRGLSRLTLAQLVFLSQSLATTLVTMATEIVSLITFGLVFGFFDGAFACLIGIVGDDVFKSSDEALNAIGQLFKMITFPYAFGMPFAAWLYKESGSYQVPFFVCGGILFIASALISLVRYWLQSRDTDSTISLPVEIIISPVDEDNPVQNNNGKNLLALSRSCSLADMAIEACADSHHKSSKLNENFENNRNHASSKIKNGEAVEKQGFFDDTQCKRHDQEACSSSNLLRQPVCHSYTDITKQISGAITL